MELAEKYKINFVEISAKNKEQIDSMMRNALDFVYMKK